MAPQDRGPNSEDKRRMDELRERQTRPAGDPRVTGTRGTPGQPFHVVIEDAADKFFDSFRAPNAEQGPQRSEGAGRTGESMFRALLTDQEAIAQAAKEVTNQLRTAADMVTRFSVQASTYGDALRAEREAERTRIDDVLTRIERSFIAPQGAPQGGGGPGGGGGRRPGGGRGPGGGGNRPAGPDLGYERLATHMAQSHRGGIQQRVRRMVAEDYHQRFGQGTEHSPTVVPVHNDDGTLSHFEERGPGGQVLGVVNPDDPQAPSMARRAMRSAAVSRAAGAVAAGRGLGGAVGAGIGGMTGAAGGMGTAAGALGGVARLGMRAAPVVGTAMAVGDAAGSAFRFAQDQRAKNAFYQATYGGANTEGFGQRFQEKTFSLGQFFTTGLQDEEARQLFKGTSTMGFKDSQRAAMTDFGQRNYKSMGMGVDQSLQAIDIAASGANTGLVGLEKALTSVTKTARTTGQSADVMRQKFLGSFQAATQAGFGVQSANVAQVLTQAGPGASRALQNVDYNGMLGEDQQRILAAGMGKSYGQLVAQNARGDITPMLEAQDQRIDQAVKAVVPPDAQKVFDQEIQKAGGMKAVQQNPAKMRDIGLRIIETGQVDPGNLRDLMQAYGVDMSNVPTEAVPEWLAREMGGADLSKQAEAQEKAEGQRELTRDDRRAGGGLFGNGPSTFTTENTASAWGWMTSGGARHKDKVVEAYQDRQGDTGKVDPAIESLITTVGDKSEVGIEVQTKDGPRVVSQAEAIQYYPDQIAKGTATITGGPKDMAGRSVGELTGVTEKNFKGADTTSSAANEDAEGVSPEEWREDHESSYDDEAGKGDGKITIAATDELKRLFNFQGEGSVNGQVESGASAGVPPAITGGPR